MKTWGSRLLEFIKWKLRYTKPAESSATIPPKRTGTLAPTKVKLQTKHPAWRIILNQCCSARWGQRARISILKPKLLNEQNSRFKSGCWRNEITQETILRTFRIKIASSFHAFTGWDISAGWLNRKPFICRASFLLGWSGQITTWPPEDCKST